MVDPNDSSRFRNLFYIIRPNRTIPSSTYQIFNSNFLKFIIFIFKFQIKLFSKSLLEKILITLRKNIFVTFSKLFFKSISNQISNFDFKKIHQEILTNSKNIHHISKLFFRNHSQIKFQFQKNLSHFPNLEQKLTSKIDIEKYFRHIYKLFFRNHSKKNISVRNLKLFFEITPKSNFKIQFQKKNSSRFLNYFSNRFQISISKKFTRKF